MIKILLILSLFFSIHLSAQPRVQTLVNAKGDTLIQMKLVDAKSILSTILEKQVVDSLLCIYIKRDSLNTNTIQLQVSKIKLLQEKSFNQELLYSNLEKVISNKDVEMKIQKKEIKRQKRLKLIAITTSIVLPILILVLK